MLFWRWLKKIFAKLWGFIKQPWFLWLLLFVGLSLLVWFVGDFWSVLSPPSYRLAIILVLVIAWALNHIRLLRKESRISNKEISEEALYTADDLNVARQTLETQYSQALRLVSKNPFLKRKHSLPWYITLGLPNAGKTSSLLSSGLYFPEELNAGENKAYCNFRFSDRGVFLDTHGLLSLHGEQDSLPKAVWFELLTLIHQYRFRKTFAGIVLSVNLADLLSQTLQQRSAHALALRNRLYELGLYLGYQCPVYLQFTNMDRIFGFNEFVDSLPELDQGQVLGFCLPNQAQTETVRFFVGCFDQLIDKLQQHLIRQLAQEMNAQKASAAFLFPSQLQSLKSVLQVFFTQLFESNHYQEKAFARGVFFVSTEFSAMPQNYLLEGHIHSFGIRVKAPTYLIKTKQSAFLRDLYAKLITQETRLYRYTSAQKKYLHVRNSIVIASLVALIVAMTYQWAMSYRLNAQGLDQVRANAENYLNYFQSSSEVMDGTELLMLYHIKHVFDPVSDGYRLRWGLYQGDRVNDAIEVFYFPHLSKQFLPILMNDITTQLQNLEPNNLSNLYSFLRAYLMLGDPSHVDKAFMRGLMDNYWYQKYPQTPEIQQVLNYSLSDYLDYPKRMTLDDHLIAKARQALHNISLTQQIYYQLLQLSYGQYYALADEFDHNFSMIFDNKIVNPKILSVFSKNGYNTIYLKNIDNLIAQSNDANWILGKPSTVPLSASDKAQLQKQVYAYYMQQYIKTWRDSLYSYQIASFTDLDSAADILQLLASHDSPIQNMLQAVKDNTALSPGDEQPIPGQTRNALLNNGVGKNTQQAVNLASRGTSGLKSMGNSQNAVKNISNIKQLFGGAASQRSPIGSAFYPLNSMVIPASTGTATPNANGSITPYDQILAAFVALSTYVNAINTAADPNQAAFEAAVQHLQKADGTDPLNNLVKLANQVPEPLSTWLNTIVQNTWQVILASAAQHINTIWQTDIFPQYQQVMSQYPFNKNASVDLSVSQLSDFLAANGALDKFFTAYMLPFVNTTTKPWLLQPVLGQRLPINQQALEQFYRWQQLRDSLFTAGTNTISVSFSVDTYDLSDSNFSADLQIANQDIISRHAPTRATSVIWPGQSPGNQINITFQNVNGSNNSLSADGFWALFKLFDQATDTVLRPSDGALLIGFKIDNNYVVYVIKTDLKFNPFNLRALRSLTLPSQLTE